MRKPLLFLVLLLVLGVITFLVKYELALRDEPSRHRAFLAEKHGRVIDARTGAGIPGVTMIASWHTTYLSWKTSYNCNLQTLVTTDSDGGYVIPDVSKDVDVTEAMLQRMLGLEVAFHWQLVAYKHGYSVRNLSIRSPRVRRRSAVVGA